MSNDTEKEAKKAQAQLYRDFQLHVSLIQRRDNLTKAQATFKAWSEGQLGLASALGQLTMPLEPYHNG